MRHPEGTRLNKEATMRKKQLKSKALQWYWFALFLIVLLCLSVILKLPNVQAMTMIVWSAPL